MFASGKGTPLNLNNLLNRVILPTLKASGVGKSFAWHRLRRGVATILHDLGVDDHTIKTILRHSDVKTTQGSYIKSLPGQSIDAMKKFEVAAEAEAQRLTATTVH
jgi:integrase